MNEVVLIAIADSARLQRYRQFFTALGYAVHTAEGGVDCLSQLRVSTPDVLILDSDLPWGGGDGVLAWIREEHATPGLPVVLLTNGPPACDHGEPAVHCLKKPVSIAALLDAVCTAVARPRPQLTAR